MAEREKGEGDGMSGLNEYKAFYHGKSIEVTAETAYRAQLAAISHQKRKEGKGNMKPLELWFFVPHNISGWRLPGYVSALSSRDCGYWAQFVCTERAISWCRHYLRVNGLCTAVVKRRRGERL